MKKSLGLNAPTTIILGLPEPEDFYYVLILESVNIRLN